MPSIVREDGSIEKTKSREKKNAEFIFKEGSPGKKGKVSAAEEQKIGAQLLELTKWAQQQDFWEDAETVLQAYILMPAKVRGEGIDIAVEAHFSMLPPPPSKRERERYLGELIEKTKLRGLIKHPEKAWRIWAIQEMGRFAERKDSEKRKTENQKVKALPVKKRKTTR